MAGDVAAAPPAVLCRGVVKRFFRYEHRTSSLREVFIRAVLRRPIHVRRAEFILDGFDLRVDPGEGVALIGSNGSGKSTALRLIAGIYVPTEGVVETHGRVTAVIELGAGFQTELTGLENVSLYAAVLGFKRRELAERLPDILAFAELGDFIHEPVKYYSSGMQARLAFSVAVCVRPDVLLIDEVLAVGDQAFRQRCLERLREFRRQGGALVVVSHDLENVRELCSRALWLERGRVRMEGTAEEVTAAYERENG
ncbi:MAG TPA: ABC transporter ATP-binding protein [Thermoanaerobaculia bacterium]|nr:ABC transporter ATP-binding protein [Thermoanaerobaculia bacterium]